MFEPKATASHLDSTLKLGATRCLRKPFRPTTLLSVIDECLAEAEPHRKYVAALAAVTGALSEQPGKPKSSSKPQEEVVSG